MIQKLLTMKNKFKRSYLGKYLNFFKIQFNIYIKKESRNNFKIQFPQFLLEKHANLLFGKEYVRAIKAFSQPRLANSRNKTYNLRKSYNDKELNSR